MGPSIGIDLFVLEGSHHLLEISSALGDLMLGFGLAFAIKVALSFHGTLPDTTIVIVILLFNAEFLGHLRALLALLCELFDHLR